MTPRDGHVRVLPIHVANKIAAGEVVERPASVVKELVENAIDAGAKSIRISITQGGRKLVAVQDDGCGMSKDDAILSLERQATSKILDVGDIEAIDTLGFRGEAIPSIASVSRFSLTTRRHESDEGTFVAVNAGTIAEVRAAGCPPGTLVEVRDLFCNVPARRKFLRAYATEEAHVKRIFTVHALAHPAIGFSLTVDGRELYRLAPASTLAERMDELFGGDFAGDLLPISSPSDGGDVRVSGYIEKPNLSTPLRRDQYVFVNGRPATAPAVAYAVREAYPRQSGDARPALFLFIDLPPGQVDVNVHPTKREVRFRDTIAVKRAIMAAIGLGLGAETPSVQRIEPPPVQAPPATSAPVPAATPPSPDPDSPLTRPPPRAQMDEPSKPLPVAVELPLASDGAAAKPWKWFKFLAATESGYLLIETDAGVVTINPHAARERIAFERIMQGAAGDAAVSQQLLMPETVHLSPVDAARLSAALDDIRKTGFKIDPFGRDTFKIDAIPQLTDGLSPSSVLATIAHDLAEGGARRGGRWREELIARSIARSFAGTSLALDATLATRLVEELVSCRMPYVCPRGKPVMIFTSTRELDRKFAR